MFTEMLFITDNTLKTIQTPINRKVDTCASSISLRIEEYQRKEGTEIKGHCRDLLGTKAPLCPLFLVCRKRLWSPRPSLSSKE